MNSQNGVRGDTGTRLRFCPCFPFYASGTCVFNLLTLVPLFSFLSASFFTRIMGGWPSLLGEA